ncbi:hypothetical protein Ancab_013299 [Ancistrocladus abbreviatus]
MASANYAIVLYAALIIAFLQASAVLGDHNHVCDEVDCGKGRCEASGSSELGFTCECDPGWLQCLPLDISTNAKDYFPCVFPNCTLDYICIDLQSPAHQSKNQFHESILDPCSWIDCGGGKCKKKSLFTHECQCADGFHNVLNNPAFPCFKPCAYGVDCWKVVNTPFYPEPYPPDSVTDQGSWVQHDKLLSVIIFIVISTAFVLWIWKL